MPSPLPYENEVENDVTVPISRIMFSMLSDEFLLRSTAEPLTEDRSDLDEFFDVVD